MSGKLKKSAKSIQKGAVRFGSFLQNNPNVVAYILIGLAIINARLIIKPREDIEWYNRVMLALMMAFMIFVAVQILAHKRTTTNNE